MLNAVWVGMILLAIMCGALTGRMEAVTQQSVVSAKAGVMLAIGLVGIMAFWLGMVQVAREAGLLRTLARGLQPIMVRLFPDVPPEHPAMSAMIMNMSANMLGLGNAATPFGLKAMIELDRLNQHKGTATNAMALFLAINTSNIALFPTSVVAVRAAMGANNPTGIVFTTFAATAVATVVAIVAAKLMQGLPRYQAAHAPNPPTPDEKPHTPQTSPDTKAGTKADTKADTKAESPPPANKTGALSSSQETLSIESDEAAQVVLPSEDELGPTSFPPTPWWGRGLQWLFWLGLLFAAGLHLLHQWLAHVAAHTSAASFGWSGVFDVIQADAPGIFSLSRDLLSFWLLPILMAAILLLGVSRGVKVYEALVVGAKEGWDVAVRIIPYLVAILVAIGMFRASGAMEIMIHGIAPLSKLIGMPPETLPMALMRPLSGSGALGIMVETMQTYGPDSMIGNMVSTFHGSTETTFYTLAVYFGAVQIKNIRHTLNACLLADFVAVLMSVWLCLWMFA